MKNDKKKNDNEKNSNNSHLDFEEPLKIENHEPPVTRRDFLGRGLIAGAAAVVAPTLFSLSSSKAFAGVTAEECGILSDKGNKVPFICVDLSGGANIAGSNVLVGGPGGQKDFLSIAGYSKLGLPETMIPSLDNQIATMDDSGLGLAFHADSALLKGIKDIATQDTLNNVNGAVMCARSSNDTSDNPHNPMYGIYKAGANGDLLPLIGSRSSDSGGRSVAPPSMIDLSVRPTKINSGNDARGLIDTGKLAELLPSPVDPSTGLPTNDDAVNVMKTIQRISEKKLGRLQTSAEINKIIECRYLESATAAAGSADRTNIDKDDNLFNLFDERGFNMSDFQKTAAVSKLVVNGVAGAGTIQFGGYDYHNSTRTTGDDRDRKAGREIGAALEYASRQGKKVMIYVFSDGSVASDGTLDETGKGIWKNDNSSTAASLMLVYDPNGLPEIINNNSQIGHFRPSGSIETAATVISDNVEQLAESVILNFMALNGDVGKFTETFPNHGLGTTAADLDKLIAFAPI